MNVKGNTHKVAIDFCRKDKTNISIELIVLNCCLIHITHDCTTSGKCLDVILVNSHHNYTVKNTFFFPVIFIDILDS